MNDEIKEILVSLKSQCKSAKGCTNNYYKVKDIEQLLDYITNLQQENERIEKECVNKINQLGELSSRIYKAIEYINKNLTLVSILDGKKFYGLNDYKFSYQDLLNILQNGSDDNER